MPEIDKYLELLSKHTIFNSREKKYEKLYKVDKIKVKTMSIQQEMG